MATSTSHPCTSIRSRRSWPRAPPSCCRRGPVRARGARDPGAPDRGARRPVAAADRDRRPRAASVRAAVRGPLGRHLGAVLDAGTAHRVPRPRPLRRRPLLRAGRARRGNARARRQGRADPARAGRSRNGAGGYIHSVAHVDGEPAVSIHAYSPPLMVVGQYSQDVRRPPRAHAGARPQGAVRRHHRGDSVQLPPPDPARRRRPPRNTRPPGTSAGRRPGHTLAPRPCGATLHPSRPFWRPRPRRGSGSAAPPVAATPARPRSSSGAAAGVRAGRPRRSLAALPVPYRRLVRARAARRGGAERACRSSPAPLFAERFRWIVRAAEGPGDRRARPCAARRRRSRVPHGARAGTARARPPAGPARPRHPRLRQRRPAPLPDPAATPPLLAGRYVVDAEAVPDDLVVELLDPALPPLLIECRRPALIVATATARLQPADIDALQAVTTAPRAPAWTTSRPPHAGADPSQARIRGSSRRRHEPAPLSRFRGLRALAIGICHEPGGPVLRSARSPRSWRARAGS